MSASTAPDEGSMDAPRAYRGRVSGPGPAARSAAPFAVRLTSSTFHSAGLQRFGISSGWEATLPADGGTVVVTAGAAAESSPPMLQAVAMSASVVAAHPARTSRCTFMRNLGWWGRRTPTSVNQGGRLRHRTGTAGCCYRGTVSP